MPDGQAGTAAQEAMRGAELPSWDLTDLYAAPDSAALAADLDAAEADARRFAETHAGRLGAHSGAVLAHAIAEFERIDEVLGRAMSYAQLLFAGDSTDAAIGKFYQSMSERITAISSHLLFFTLELNRLDDAAMEQKLADPALARWRPWLRDLRVFRSHQLSDELEKLLHEKEVTGRSAWSRLFDETIAGLRVSVSGEELTVSAALNKLSDRDRAVREAAGRAIGTVFQANVRLFSLVTNTLAKDKEIIDTWRRYPRPGSYRNRSNMVEDEVVDALVSAVTADYPRLSHRYYTLKAKWLGLEKLQHWDRNAPLPDDADGQVSWPEARARVLDAYGAFSPELAAVGERFFQRPWIDATLKPGKSGGAFAHPTVPSVHPYLLMNFHGRTRDVMTLAHELGHGVHQVLAGQQGYLLSGTPLTLAETASVFGEMLTFRAMLDAQTDPARRRIMLAGKVEDMLNTVVRQTAFYQFETLLHDERRSGEIVPDRIGEIWMKVQRDSLGPAFEFTPDYKVFWSYVPHFIHSPFYVYAYAFGDCLVNALYGVFRDGHPGFQAKYLDMLRAGGTKRHRELLVPFGLDASEPKFWRRGLDVISGFIDELEAFRLMAQNGEGGSIFGEIRRFARTSGAVGGIAARVVGERAFGIRTDRAAHAEDLRTILGGLKGPLMKVAQFLSTVPDALPAEYAEQLAHLQSNAPAMGAPFVRRRMQSELGPDWRTRFASFSETASAAASLGQVHRATLPDGRVVACKLQYPDMASTVEADLRQLKLAMAVYRRMDNAIHQEDIYEELATRLREELDYRREAAQMRLYGVMLASEPNVHVPAPIESHSTARLLTMSWLDGRALMARLEENPTQEERNHIAEALFRAWYVPFYRYGVIHGDPHLGNYQVASGDAVNLLDYGVIRVFPPQFVRGVIDLYEAVRDGDEAKSAHAYETWGFSSISREQLSVLNEWARFLYEPLMQDRVRAIQESDDPQYGRAVAERVHAGLKRTGGVRPPREFVLMDRSAIGLGSVFLRLGAKLNWSRLFHELIDDFDVDRLASRQAEAMQRAGLAPIAA